MALHAPKWAARADEGSRRLDEAAQALGCSVEVIKPAKKGGIPDRLWGVSGVNILVEYKVEKGKLSQRQLDWWAAWRGEHPFIARTIEDVEAIVKGVRNRGK